MLSQAMSGLAGRNILLIVGGSIAAYKSAELLRELIKNGAKVRVILTKAAEEFVTPLTLQTLSGNSLYGSLFDLTAESEIGHIRLADEPDLVVVAPATANQLAKFAQGVADDLASTVMLATRAPILIAPAMNVNMWQHPATRSNMEILRGRSVNFVGPERGDLACGWEGEGRLSNLGRIILESERVLANKSSADLRFVVSAGSTQEPIDPVRYISNRASGFMGCALARSAWLLGAEVQLVHGSVCHSALALVSDLGLSIIQAERAEEIRNSLLGMLLSQASPQITRQVLFMSAAVSDHRPKAVSSQKLKRDKTKDYQLEMEPNVDILQEILAKRDEIVANSGLSTLLVGFCLESASTDNELIELARQKLKRRSGLDFIVANSVNALGSENTKALLLDSSGALIHSFSGGKVQVARELIAAVETQK